MAKHTPDDDLLALPEAERARLAQVLIRSLESEVQDPEAEAAWWDEVQRRIRDLDEGRTSARGAKDALTDIRDRLRRG